MLTRTREAVEQALANRAADTVRTGEIVIMSVQVRRSKRRPVRNASIIVRAESSTSTNGPYGRSDLHLHRLAAWARRWPSADTSDNPEMNTLFYGDVGRKP